MPSVVVLNSGDLPNCFNERLAVMGSSPADQRAVDIEQYKIHRMVASDSDKFRIGLVQMSCGQDPAANLDHAVSKIREAAERGAQIVCLQELFRSQYFCREEDARLFDLAEAIPGPSTDLLCPLAAELGVVIIASLFEKRATGLYHNTAAIIDADGTLLGIYRKMHIPDDPLFFEKFYFTPGDLGFRAFDTKFGASRRSSAGINGIRKPRVWLRSRAPIFSSIRPLSAGIHRKKPSMAPRSMMRGARRSAPTPSRTASMSPP